MKKIVVVIFVMVFSLSLFAEFIECSGGTSSSKYVPVYGFYSYTWSKVIYKAEDLQNTANTITGLQYQFYNSPDNYEMLNQTIYIKHETASSFSNSIYDNPLLNGATKVFDGNINFNGTAAHWFEIDFNMNDFEYNGTDNIVIYWENRNGSWAGGYPKWFCDNVNNSSVYKYLDASFPTSNGTLSDYKPNIRFNIENSPEPECPLVDIVNPQNNEVNVRLDAYLSWNELPILEGYNRGYEIIFNGEQIDVVDGNSYALEGRVDYSTSYTCSVKPFYEKDLVKIYPTENPEIVTFYTLAGAAPDTPVEENPITDIEIVIPDNAIPNVPQILAELPTDYDYQPLVACSYDFDLIGDYTILIESQLFTDDIINGNAHLYIGGNELVYAVEWIGVEGGGLGIEYYYDGSKGEKDIVVTNLEDNTLPVTLSSFNAVAYSDEYVSINWVTESESNLLGFNVLRAESENVENSVRVNSSMIAPNNTSQTSEYSFVDDEVTAGIYYYWLETRELSNEVELSQAFMVEVKAGDDSPQLPTETLLGNPYPSPFAGNTQADLRVKDGETASVTVYNLLGQVVKRESFSAGNHTFEWNGNDSKGNKTASGIYFFRMTTPSQTKSYKVLKLK